jgi:hypothetical protein
VRAVLLLAVAAIGAGCGSDGGNGGGSADSELAKTTLPADDYVRRADDICRDTVRRVLELRDEVEGTPTAKEGAALLERQLEIIREMRARLAALGSPQGKREIAEEFIADIHDAEPHLADTIEALRDGDQRRAEAAAQRYREATMESARQVRDSGLDFEVCGSGA